MPFNYWLFVICVLSLTAFVGYSTFVTARLLQKWRPNQNVLLLRGENLLRLIIILICLALGRLSGLSNARLGWQFPHPIRQVLGGIFLGLAIGIFFYYTTRWVIQRTGQRFYSSIVIELIVPADRRELVLVLLAMVPVVILEELLFRSLLLGGLTPLAPAPLLLVGLSVLFGLLHSPQGIWGMVGAGLAGLFLGLLFLWQASLLTPLVTHYVVNMFQVVQVMSQAKKQSAHPSN
jgi:membrane protease YdiL (CAAX protease family)